MKTGIETRGFFCEIDPTGLTCNVQFMASRKHSTPRGPASDRKPCDFMTIRPATLDDLPTLVEYNRRLALETESITLSVKLLNEGVRAALLDPSKGRYFVAEDDGQIIGQLMHTREWSDWRNGDIWWLQSVYVHADHRQKGVFRELVNHLKAEAQGTPEVVGLRLYMEEHNDRAAATYDRLGLAEAGYVVRELIWRNWDSPDTGK